jgi:hypothetical protein
MGTQLCLLATLICPCFVELIWSRIISPQRGDQIMTHKHSLSRHLLGALLTGCLTVRWRALCFADSRQQ